VSRRRASATTLARQQRAWANRDRAIEALREGRTLLVSNRTTHGTVHAGTARRLVQDGYARYVTRGGTWLDMTKIIPRTRADGGRL
jgi:hypothetical protein